MFALKEKGKSLDRTEKRAFARASESRSRRETKLPFVGSGGSGFVGRDRGEERRDRALRQAGSQERGGSKQAPSRQQAASSKLPAGSLLFCVLASRLFAGKRKQLRG